MKKIKFPWPDIARKVVPAAPTAPTAESILESVRESKIGRNKELEYKTQFIREATIAARSGKTVYISKEHHERILKMLHVIGKNDVSIFAFIHNVVEDHFETYRDSITDLYDKNIEQVF